MFDRRSFLKIAGFSAIATPALMRSAAARTTTITVASLLGEDKPETKIWRWIAAQMEERRPGRFKFSVVTNGALGGEKEVAESTRLGSVQASLSTVSSLSGWVPELQILDLPFLFRDAAHLKNVVDGDTGKELSAKLEAQNFIIGGFIDYGARHLLTKEPVTRPQQMASKKIRVINSPLHTKLWSAFGAVPVGIPITETYNALASGVADAMDLTKSAYAGFKLYEVVPCMTETAHIRASGVIFYAANFWKGLDAEDKAALSEVSQKATSFFNGLVVDDEAESVATAKAHGGQVFQPEALDAWRNGARSVWQDFASIVGGMDKIAAIEKA
jgi:tripartite ATP-independent transporter DctP family solute receptor